MFGRRVLRRCLMLVWFAAGCCSGQIDDDFCKTTAGTDNGSYACKPADQCPTVFRHSSYPKICRFRGRTPVVCCPVPGNTPGTRAAQKCREYYSLTTRGGGTIDAGGCRKKKDGNNHGKNRLTIVGGSEAGEGEFPHMVLLGFGEHVAGVEWSCGGSLVSDRYVLSAAHCSVIRKKNPVKWVLLGDNDLEKDGKNSDPEIREIVARILHPDYKPSLVYNDIGLYRLNTPVKFNNFILPVCINAERTLYAEQAIAIGWGRTDSAGPTSNVLMKVSLDLVGQNECNRSYSSSAGRSLVFGINPDSQICAGQMEGGKDTCQGDSGGPLQIVHPEFECMYAQVGVTSFGKLCGEPDAPGVYTRVSNYVSWIESHVWPDTFSDIAP